MLKIFVFKRRTLYIALAVLVIIIIAAVLLMSLSGSNETFSETMKYVYRKISPEQTKVLIEKNTDITILDLRSEKEYSQGHLPSAQQVSYSELKKNLDYYNRESIYVIYGDSDRKSAKAAEVLANNGFSKVYMLNGGMEEWPFEIE